MKKIPCSCRCCWILADLAVLLSALGDHVGAEMAAREITWYVPEQSTDAEGYTNTWRADDASVN